MTRFDPTRAPAGRLARLGVVVDPGQPGAAAVATFCDRAGIEIVWFGRLSRELDAVEVDRSRPPELDRARLGLIVGPGATPGSADEILVVGSGVSADHVRRLRAAEGSARVSAARVSAAAGSLADLRPLLDVVDDIVLPAWRFPDLEAAADEARAEAEEIGRDPDSLGVAALVPVSIGRTGTEAEARADRDPLFAELGHPAEIGIFGTLEECQDRVIALAHAGISDLRCILPAAPDVHDVIAQLTAVTIGTTEVLVPGSLRSPAPPPPEGWGGRPEQPPRRGVSGGSRRRD